MGYGYKYDNNNNNSLPQGNYKHYCSLPSSFFKCLNGRSSWCGAGRLDNEDTQLLMVCVEHLPHTSGFYFLFLNFYIFFTFSEPHRSDTGSLFLFFSFFFSWLYTLDGVHFTSRDVCSTIDHPRPDIQQEQQGSSFPICAGSLSPIIGRPEYNKEKELKNLTLSQPSSSFFNTLPSEKRGEKKRDVVRRNSQQGLDLRKISVNQHSGTWKSRVSVYV